ncbi:DUF3348 domain-containing protein [Xanthomonas maliensis]|uniref:DUF3348 domain-containing protein n=1 Tax=Xanthomonas maliensis TaxID=1321368 RepID=UPI0003AA5E2C|nr:DUF3348 domain-containing protein [Xanthomonas maliensis]KAB7771523.1 DUF3348 domain-containing protein [Xanthomonas maliensis]
MAKAAPRAPLPGPAFIRLLARLTDASIAPSPLALADRLADWIDWTRAVAVSKALDGRLPAIDPATDVDTSEAPDWERSRAGLASTCVGELEAIVGRARAQAAAAADDDTATGTPDYAPFRQHYLAMQRAMRTATGDLRGRLRDLLAARPDAMARLAEVDAVMEATLSPREQSLLNHVPNLLGLHFERLASEAARASSDAWLELFRKDLQSVLLAELDIRFHPIQALSAALRTR